MCYKKAKEVRTIPEIIEILPIKEENSIKRVCAYARVSSASEDQSLSYFNQVEYYTNLINSRPDWKMVDIYADNAKTGTKKVSRPDFNRMIQDCKDRKIDIILTKSVSRFARNTYDCMNIVNELKEYGVSIRFEAENLDTSKEQDIQSISTYAAMAQSESESTALNARISIRQKMQMGTFIQTNPPYGYCYDNRELKINEEQAKIVKRIFESYVSGRSTVKIADELMNENIINKLGKVHWTPSGISYILRNVRYKGDALLQKSFKADFPYKKHINTGELDKYYIRNANEPIVSEELFDTANRLIEKNKEKHCKKSDGEKSIFSKMIYCENCKSSFRRKGDYWVCRTHDMLPEKCSVKGISEADLKDIFVKMFNRLKANYEYILLPFIAIAQNAKTDEDEKTMVSEINIEIAKITEQLVTTERLKEKNIIETDFYIEESNRLNKEIMDLRARKNDILHGSIYENSIVQSKELIHIFETKNALAKFDEKIFKKMIKKIEISEDKVGFILSNEMELEIYEMR